MQHVHHPLASISHRLWLFACDPRTQRAALHLFFFVAIWLLLAGSAFASDGGDPWSSSLTGLAKTLNGTVARTIGTIALFAAGGMLVFGGELNEFTKKILMVVLAVAVMVLGGGMIDVLFKGA